MRALLLGILTAFAGEPVSADAAVGTFNEPTVVVAVTRAELRWTGRLAFAWASAGVVRGLRDVPGRLDHHVGFGGIAGIAWTSTAWRDEASLEAFLVAAAHRRAMSEGQSALRSMASARFRCPEGAMPKTLAEVEAWLDGRAPMGCHPLVDGQDT